MRLIYLPFLISILISIYNCCKVIKYKTLNGETENTYFKDPELKCHDKPVYKTKDNPFYIYKSPNDDFWCDAFVPSKILSCNAECNEIRFKFDDILTESGAIPDEFDSSSSTWNSKPSDSVFCDLLEAPAPKINQIKEPSVTETTTVSDVKINEKSNQHEEDNLILNTLLLLENQEKNSKKKQILEKKITPTKNMTLEIYRAKQKHEKNYNNSQSISSKTSKSCPKIELQIIEDSGKSLQYNLNFNLYFGVNCRGYPVYRTPSNVFLFRNIRGDWCQDKLENFVATKTCSNDCKEIKLGPSGIKSPTESHYIYVLKPRTGEVDFKSKNYRYVCAPYINCMNVKCLNGGTCAYSYNKGSPVYKCVCPPHFTGTLCEVLYDSCFSNPCKNGGLCISKSYEAPICLCDEFHHGDLCQHKNDPCDPNPCKNGGLCKVYNRTESCQCTPKHSGKYCERVSSLYRPCDGASTGDIVAHPEDNKLFYICLTNSFYSMQSCPIGLVFNEHLKRCDYSIAAPENLHECDVNKCQNGGTCEKIDRNKFVCICQMGFAGEFCQINIDDCAKNKCGDTNKCVDLIDGHVCLCENNFYGEDCLSNKVPIPCGPDQDEKTPRYIYPFDPSVVVECTPEGRLHLSRCPASLYWNPIKASCTYEPMYHNSPLECMSIACKNGGSCLINSDNKPFCHCPIGFRGDFCEENINECSPNPCMNNGTCIDGYGGHYCVCANKYLDKDCCCVNDANPCANVLSDILTKKDKIVRHRHPYSREKFLVCNLEGFAQVLSCPDSLIWYDDEQTCGEKNQEILNMYMDLCYNTKNPSSVISGYAYSKLKYVTCVEDSYQLNECPKETPYFCDRKKKCVGDLKIDCN